MKIDYKDTFITDNSGECESGCFFLKTEANARFEESAINNGAKIIDIHEAKNLLNISKNLKIVGITGTNGKTTTAAAIYATLIELGFSAALSGTRGAFINGKRIDEKGLTTSSVIKTLSYQLEATKAECEYLIMEVSSHAIAQNRIEGIEFALKIFTNISQDHLDYHKTMQDYIAVKSKFLSDESPKIINKDDKFIRYNLKNTLTYALKSPATLSVLAYGLGGGIDAVLKTPDAEVEFSSDMVGEFNLYNLLAAFLALKFLTKFDDKKISNALGEFSGVEGRMQVISNDPQVIVDFAHTPDGIEKVLDSLKNNKLIVVFGAGGDRDRTKRPIMGKMVEHFAEISIITSDNPRSEEPEEIIEEIWSGMSKKDKILKIPNRKEAIEKAINLAKNGEVVVILGKGDESYQEIKSVKHPFSDEKCVLEILKENK